MPPAGKGTRVVRACLQQFWMMWVQSEGAVENPEGRIQALRTVSARPPGDNEECRERNDLCDRCFRITTQG